jgi:acyl-CoA reductase-like NAD-dependent aldehyde dehydrogenase
MTAASTVGAAPPRLSQHIDGARVDTLGDGWLEDGNPSDASDTLALVPEGSPEDVDAAVQAAQHALPAWRSLTGPARATHLYAWADRLNARGEELAQIVTREVGKPITEARGEVARGVAILRYYAGEAVRGVGDVIPSQLAGTLQYTRRDPLGVVGLITPWNFPVAIPLWKAAPALAFGNTVVLKPSELSPVVALALADSATAAGLPHGMFNVVLGTGLKAGSPLLAHPLVRGVSFTGSAAVGAHVAATCAARNIRYQTEMGGKNVAIVLGDADLDRAASLVAGGAMRYAGQKCTATSRVIVAKSVESAFLAKLSACVDALPLGPVTDPAAAVGPLISEAARERVRRAVDAANAERLPGRAAPGGATYSRGWYYAPTVLRGVAAESPIAQREVFGPVLVVLVADDLEHALALANATPYGLSAALFTRDLASVLTYVQRIEAGLVRVNGDTTGVDPHAPFGGVKGSSSGTREQGPAAREFYTDVKTMQVSA